MPINYHKLTIVKAMGTAINLDDVGRCWTLFYLQLGDPIFPLTLWVYHVWVLLEPMISNNTGQFLRILPETIDLDPSNGFLHVCFPSWFAHLLEGLPPNMLRRQTETSSKSKRYKRTTTATMENFIILSHNFILIKFPSPISSANHRWTQRGPGWTSPDASASLQRSLMRSSSYRIAVSRWNRGTISDGRRWLTKAIIDLG